MEVCSDEIDSVVSSHYFYTNHVIFLIFLENVTAKNHEELLTKKASKLLRNKNLRIGSKPTQKG